MRISAIFNKKKNFHVSNFSLALIWGVAVATPLADRFCWDFLKLWQKVKTGSHGVWEP